MANIKRLKRLVTVLERVIKNPDKRRDFDMGAWAQETADCGTHMCACGWAASDPVLKKQGLKLKWKKNIWGDLHAELKYRKFLNFDAAIQFFDLNETETGYLFSCNSYDSMRAMRPVIDRIKSVIRTYS